MATLVLVRTPLNAVCASESLAVLERDPAECVVAINDAPRPVARRQLWSALDDTRLIDGARAVRLLPSTGFGASMIELRQFGRSVRSEIDEVIIGSYMMGSFRYLIDVIEPARVVLIDDGAGTLLVARRRAEWIRGGRQDAHLRWNEDRNVTSVNRVRSAAGRGLSGLRLHPGFYADLATEPHELTFCTYLTLPEPHLDPVVRHTFGRLREDLDGAVASEQVLVLGSPLVRSGKIELVDYLEYLEQLRSRFGDFSYIAHRQERPDDLRQVERLGVAVDQPRRCMELAVGRDYEVPSRVVAPWSSALESLGLILEGRSVVECVPIALGRFRTEARARARARYEMLEGAPGVEVELGGY